MCYTPLYQNTFMEKNHACMKTNPTWMQNCHKGFQIEESSVITTGNLLRNEILRQANCYTYCLVKHKTGQ